MSHPAHYVQLRVDEVQFWVPKGVQADIKHLVSPYGESAEPADGPDTSGGIEELKAELKKASAKIKAKNKNISDMQKEIKTLEDKVKELRAGGDSAP